MRLPTMRVRAVMLACVSMLALCVGGWNQKGQGATNKPAAGAGTVNPNADAAIKTFLDTEIKGVSTLDRPAQEAEMKWFAQAAAPFRGMEIKVVSESLTTHDYESKVLAKAFYDITGIKVVQDVIQEGDLVEKIQTQMQ